MLFEFICKTKESIRKRFSALSNYPLVCESCARPLGILHSDPIAESIYLEPEIATPENRKNMARSGSLRCSCGVNHDLHKYVSEEPVPFPTEQTMSLEELAEKRAKELAQARS